VRGEQAKDEFETSGTRQEVGIPTPNNEDACMRGQLFTQQMMAGGLILMLLPLMIARRRVDSRLHSRQRGPKEEKQETTKHPEESGTMDYQVPILIYEVERNQ
jgi:hypothetical protein